nr:uncharacterized protein LOC107281890 [Oryza sativa Japonica Group]
MARATIGAAILVCVVILALDVTAGILGLQAQIAQNKVKTVRMLFIECEQSSSKMEFIRASIKRKLAATLIVLSWLALIAGFSLLLAGAMRNSNPRRNCSFAQGHTLDLGGILCFVHAGVTVAYYVTANAAAYELP